MADTPALSQGADFLRDRTDVPHCESPHAGGRKPGESVWKGPQSGDGARWGGRTDEKHSGPVPGGSCSSCEPLGPQLRHQCLSVVLGHPERETCPASDETANLNLLDLKTLHKNSCALLSNSFWARHWQIISFNASDNHSRQILLSPTS